MGVGGGVDITTDGMEKHLIENMGLVKEGVPKETIMWPSPKERAEGAEHRAVEKALREMGRTSCPRASSRKIICKLERPLHYAM